jgi:hypothetical protein
VGSETVEIRGHLLDSGVLSRVLDEVRDYGGDYLIDRFDVGKDHGDESYARMVVSHADPATLARLLGTVQGYGVNLVQPGDVATRPAWADAYVRAVRHRSSLHPRRPSGVNGGAAAPQG